MAGRDLDALDVTEEFIEIWKGVIASTSIPVRTRVAQVAAEHANVLADRFYSSLLAHPGARQFLDHNVVSQRLHASMARWIAQLFGTLEDAQVPASVAHQLQVGAVHARVNLPATLMQVAFHNMFRDLRGIVNEVFADPGERLEATAYIGDLFHIADSLMLSTYVRDLQARVRREEAYRLISMEHDVALERERQRAALSEWVNRFLMSSRLQSRVAGAGTLTDSEFGMWIKHKAPVFFEGIQELEHVADVVRLIDEVYVPQILDGNADPESLLKLMTEFDRQVEFVRYLVADLFARLDKVTLGRDPVTRLLNQRYLPTILSREIQLQAGGGKPFAVMLAKLDGMRNVVSALDRDGREMVLQQLGVAIVDSVRAGDHAFRYGEEEFLILAVESNVQQAAGMADELRLRIRALEFHLRGHARARLTISVGVAQFDGHPDYQYLVRRAEGAAARALQEGGDRVVQAA